MPTRLYDFGDGQVLRMISLQMRGNQAHAPFEDFKRHSRLDAGSLDAAANRDTMIPIQSTQESRLPGAVTSVDHPELLWAHFERDFLQARMLVKVDGCIRETHEKFRHTLATLSLQRHGRGGVVVLHIQPTLERRAPQLAAIHEAPLFQHDSMRRARRHIFDPMRSQNPWHTRALRMSQPTHRAPAIDLVQAIQQFIEQQQLRT